MPNFKNNNNQLIRDFEVFFRDIESFQKTFRKAFFKNLNLLGKMFYGKKVLENYHT